MSPDADEQPELTDDQKTAVKVLADEAGTAALRARRLVEALQTAYAREGLGVLNGTWPISGSMVDTRVARLDALLVALHDDEAPPTPFELGAMLRITPSQATTLLRTYQARFGGKVHKRMKTRISSLTPDATGSKFVWQFDDKPTLDYAADVLRRQGYARGLEVDSIKLTLTVPQAVLNAAGDDASQFLASL